MAPAWKAPFAPPPASTMPIRWNCANFASGWVLAGALGGPTRPSTGLRMVLTHIQFNPAHKLYETRKPAKKIARTTNALRADPTPALRNSPRPSGKSDLTQLFTNEDRGSTRSLSVQRKPIRNHRMVSRKNGIENAPGRRQNTHL